MGNTWHFLLSTHWKTKSESTVCFYVSLFEIVSAADMMEPSDVKHLAHKVPWGKDIS